MKAIKSIFLLLLISIGSFAQSINDRIDPESKLGLDALLKVIPGGFKSIPDIVKRRAVTNQLFTGPTQVNNEVKTCTRSCGVRVNLRQRETY